MAVNHMAKVAAMFGVRLGERFKIINVDTNKPISEYNYYFTDKDIEIDEDTMDCSSEYLLMHLIYGDYTIQSNPWKPKEDEDYWYVDGRGDIWSTYWVEHADNMNYYKLGNCYRTEEEAEANRKKWVAFYESDEVLEV